MRAFCAVVGAAAITISGIGAAYAESPSGDWLFGSLTMSTVRTSNADVTCFHPDYVDGLVTLGTSLSGDGGSKFLIQLPILKSIHFHYTDGVSTHDQTEIGGSALVVLDSASASTGKLTFVNKGVGVTGDGRDFLVPGRDLRVFDYAFSALRKGIAVEFQLTVKTDVSVCTYSFAASFQKL